MAEPENPLAPQTADPAEPETEHGTEPGIQAETGAETPAEPGTDDPAVPGRVRRVALLSLRLVGGTVSLAAAVVIVAAVGLVPLPTVSTSAAGLEVVPVPADELRTCAGSALRLGDETGANADTPIAIGLPSVRAAAVGSTLERGTIATTDASTGGSSAAPEVLTISPADGAKVAGAQSQVVEANNYVGFAASACAQPSGSVWLAGGAMTVGRTSILTLANPTDVAAQVSLEIFGEKGAVEAPGMNGIDVPPGTQRIISLAGFAPGLASPIVHVMARGGQVVAYLQQSIVRGLDATGLDVVDAAPDPADSLTFPGVRVFDSVGTNRALSLPDWDDVSPIVRVLNPGVATTTITVSVTPVDPAVAGTSFEIEAEPGITTEVPLDSGAEVDTGVALADGLYTVTMTADQPIVGGVRVSAAADIGAVETEGPIEAPVSDLAWYSAAPELKTDTLVVIAPGPDPMLSVVNPTATDAALVLDAQGGSDITLVVPAGAAASTPVEPGMSYILRDPAGLFASVGYAADDRMAAYPVSPARPVSGPIIVRP